MRSLFFTGRFDSHMHPQSYLSYALGQVAHQKRIRKIVRLLTLPPALHMAVWQECYFRWCTLNEIAVRMALDDEVPGFPMGDRNLTVEVCCLRPHFIFPRLMSNMFTG